MCPVRSRSKGSANPRGNPSWREFFGRWMTLSPDTPYKPPKSNASERPSPQIFHTERGLKGSDITQRRQFGRGHLSRSAFPRKNQGVNLTALFHASLLQCIWGKSSFTQPHEKPCARPAKCLPKFSPGERLERSRHCFMAAKKRERLSRTAIEGAFPHKIHGANRTYFHAVHKGGVLSPGATFPSGISWHPIAENDGIF